MDHLTASPEHLASAVREALAQSGLSLNKAADLARVPRTTLKRNIHDGKFRSDHLPKVAAALGTKPSQLWLTAEQEATA